MIEYQYFHVIQPNLSVTVIKFLNLSELYCLYYKVNKISQK